MGSDESQFNVSSIVRDGNIQGPHTHTHTRSSLDITSHKTVSTDHNFWRERKAKTESNRGPSAYQPKTLSLGQTGSHFGGGHLVALHTELRYQSFVGKGFGGGVEHLASEELIVLY